MRGKKKEKQQAKDEWNEVGRKQKVATVLEVRCLAFRPRLLTPPPLAVHSRGVGDLMDLRGAR